MAAPLLKTKLHVPALRPALVARPRLIEHAELQSLDWPLTPPRWAPGARCRGQGIRGSPCSVHQGRHRPPATLAPGTPGQAGALRQAQGRLWRSRAVSPLRT
jgi:hypothetical protein